MTEDFKKRCKFEVGLFIAEQQANFIFQTIDNYENIWFEKYLEILIFAGSGCFLPKKQVLNEHTKQPYVYFTAKQPTKKIKIEYPHDCVWNILKEAGIPLDINKDYIKFKKIYYSKHKKRREDRYQRIYDIRAPKWNY